MPVSTRSQVVNRGHGNVLKSDQWEAAETMSSVPFRNPHHGLKEKMRALTELYEQQKRASSNFSIILRPNPSPRKPNQLVKRFSTHPSVDLVGSCKKELGAKEREEKKSNVVVMQESSVPNNAPALPVVRPNCNVTRTIVLPQPPTDDAKENLVMGSAQVNGLSAHARSRNGSITASRKLSMGCNLVTQAQNISFHVQEKERAEEEKNSNESRGSKILVFVRLRPMAKKEKDTGSRSCVRIVNWRDVYLTEFANDHDYLRLKRLRGRHFTFDAAFPDSTSQQEVYSTT